jgi:hypothetical protein
MPAYGRSSCASTGCHQQGGRDRQRQRDVDVDHEQRADQRATEHRAHRDQTPADVAARPDSAGGVGGDAGQRQRKDGRGQVGDGQAAGHGVLYAHGQRHRGHQHVALPRRRRLPGDRRQHRGGDQQRGGDRVCCPQVREPPVAEPCSDPAAGGRAAGNAAGASAATESRFPAAQPRNTTLPVMLATNTLPSLR